MRFTYVFLTGLFTIFLASALTAGIDDTAKEVVELKLRDHTVRIKTTEKGPLYTVFDNGAKKPLVKDLTESQLQAKNPELYDNVKSAMASGKGIIDATNHRQPATDAVGAPVVPN